MEKQIAGNEKTNCRYVFKKKREPFLFFMVYPEILLIFAREKKLKQTKTVGSRIPTERILFRRMSAYRQADSSLRNMSSAH